MKDKDLNSKIFIHIRDAIANLMIDLEKQGVGDVDARGQIVATMIRLLVHIGNVDAANTSIDDQLRFCEIVKSAVINSFTAFEKMEI